MPPAYDRLVTKNRATRRSVSPSTWIFDGPFQPARLHPPAGAGKAFVPAPPAGAMMLRIPYFGRISEVRPPSRMRVHRTAWRDDIRIGRAGCGLPAVDSSYKFLLPWNGTPPPTTPVRACTLPNALPRRRSCRGSKREWPYPGSVATACRLKEPASYEVIARRRRTTVRRAPDELRKDLLRFRSRTASLVWCGAFFQEQSELPAGRERCCVRSRTLQLAEDAGTRGFFQTVARLLRKKSQLPKAIVACWHAPHLPQQRSRNTAIPPRSESPRSVGTIAHLCPEAGVVRAGRTSAAHRHLPAPRPWGLEHA